MAGIIPGTNATITGTTAESQLLNTFLFLNIHESIPEHNPGEKDCVAGSFNLSDTMFQGTFELPCNQIIDADGRPKLVGINYLVNTNWQPGSPSGTFKSSDPVSYFIEILTYLQMQELSPTNTNEKNQVVTVYDADTKTLSGEFLLSFNTTLNGANGNEVILSIPQYI